MFAKCVHVNTIYRYTPYVVHGLCLTCNRKFSILSPVRQVRTKEFSRGKEGDIFRAIYRLCLSYTISLWSTFTKRKLHKLVYLAKIVSHTKEVAQILNVKEVDYISCRNTISDKIGPKLIFLKLGYSLDLEILGKMHTCTCISYLVTCNQMLTCFAYQTV